MKDSGSDHHLKLVYQENGMTQIFIDDLNISEHIRKLGQDLRLAVVADSDRASESADIYIKNLAVRNEMR